MFDKQKIHEYSQFYRFLIMTLLKQINIITLSLGMFSVSKVVNEKVVKENQVLG
jgi:hypothetical protein